MDFILHTSLFQFGLAGHFWFAAGMCIQLFLFAIVVAEIRIKAPGAKTYLQVKRIHMLADCDLVFYSKLRLYVSCSFTRMNKKKTRLLIMSIQTHYCFLRAISVILYVLSLILMHIVRLSEPDTEPQHTSH